MYLHLSARVDPPVDVKHVHVSFRVPGATRVYRSCRAERSLSVQSTVVLNTMHATILGAGSRKRQTKEVNLVKVALARALPRRALVLIMHESHSLAAGDSMCVCARCCLVH